MNNERKDRVTEKRIYTSKVRERMWAGGRPSTDGKFAVVYRAAIKAGLDEDQAHALCQIAFDAAHGYTWKFQETPFAMFNATQRRMANEHPNGKDAEDLAAVREGRTSRWGTREFHYGK